MGKDDNTRNKKKKKHIKEIIYAFIWVSFLVKFLIIDWDVFIIEKYLPQLMWIFKYKILFFVLLIIITSKMEKTSILLNILYFLFFPIIVVCGYIPFKIFSIGKWNGIIAYINIFIILLKRFRYKIVMLIFYILSLILILKSNNKVVLTAGILFNAYFLINMVVSAFKIIFCNSEIYSVYKNLTNEIIKREKNIKDFDYSNINTLEELKENKELISIIETKVLMNRLLLFSAKKLKDYNQSKVYTLQNIVLFIITILIGIISFAIISFGVFKLNGENYYILIENYGFIDFVLYTLKFSDCIIPNTLLSKLIEIIKGVMFLIFTGLFSCIFIESCRKKQKDEIESIIDSMTEIAQKEEKQISIKELFENIDSAIEGLKQIKSSLIGIIIKVTEKL